MAVRLVVTITAAPGKGAELAQVFTARCAEVMQEPGCEQFEVFQSVLNPDKLALLELWKDQAALDVHAKVNATRAPMPEGLRSGAGSARTTSTTGSAEYALTAERELRRTCHCEARSAEAIPRLTSRGTLVRRGIASALRASQ